MPDEIRPEDDQSLEEIQALSLEPDPELMGRVGRDINRRTLAANSLEFSLNVMVATFWEHLQAIIDSWPGTRKPEGEE
jgi:hypothetical protein